MKRLLVPCYRERRAKLAESTGFFGAALTVDAAAFGAGAATSLAGTTVVLSAGFASAFTAAGSAVTVAELATGKDTPASSVSNVAFPL